MGGVRGGGLREQGEKVAAGRLKEDGGEGLCVWMEAIAAHHCFCVQYSHDHK